MLLFHKIRLEISRDRWILYRVLFAFIAVTIHGMVDVGLTHKGIARLLYLLLGFSLCSSCTKSSFNK